MIAHRKPLTIFSRKFTLPGEKAIALGLGPSVYLIALALGIVASFRGAPTLDATIGESVPWFTFVFASWQWTMAVIALVCYFVDRLWARSTEIVFCAGLTGQFVFYDGLLMIRAFTHADPNPVVDPSYPAVYSLGLLVCVATRLLFAFNEASLLKVFTDAEKPSS